MYNGNAKCPGCGRPGTEIGRPNKDSLCWECENFIKVGRNVVDYYKLVRRVPVFPEHKQMCMTWYTIRIRAIDKAVEQLLRTMQVFDYTFCSSMKSINDSLLAGRFDAITSRDNYSIPSAMIDAAKNLCDVVRQVSEDLEDKERSYEKDLEYILKQREKDIYKEGIKEGANLLISLNRGEITPEEINKRTM